MMKKPGILVGALLAMFAGYVPTALQATPVPDGYQLLTPEEAGALQRTLSGLEGAEKEAYRQRIYEKLSKKAQAAGYIMPALPLAPAPPPKEVVLATPKPAPAAPATITKAPQTQVVKVEPKTAIPAQPQSPATPMPSHRVQVMPPRRIEPPVPPEPSLHATQEEIIGAMDTHRAAMREYMKKRRAEQSAQIASRKPPMKNNAAMAKIEQQRVLREKQREAYEQQMEARRRVMQARIDQAIQGMNAPPPYPNYRRPYNPYNR